MKELTPETLALRMVEGMRQEIRAQWYEAALIYTARAAINCQVAELCRAAGFDDAAHHFATCAVYYIAGGLYCLGMSGK